MVRSGQESRFLWTGCGKARHFAMTASLIHMRGESLSRHSPIVEKSALILLPPAPSRF